MLLSMTGFGGREAKTASFGKISVELRSTNHKFLEIVLHVPDGFLSLEDKIKKEIESGLRRGRVTCVINISGTPTSNVFINQALLKKYAAALKQIRKQLSFQEGISLDTLIRLPGVLSLEENNVNKTIIWPRLKALLEDALDDLLKMRQKEGRALKGFLERGVTCLAAELAGIKTRFKKAVGEKIDQLGSDEERAVFLKDADITEEIDRLGFHIKNFLHTLKKDGPIGKELDFIAQEMQREANTMGAKSFDTAVSGSVVQAKSQIEKIREQVQNIE
jgi:uncharacterized protein (TIGR00255 family)